MRNGLGIGALALAASTLLLPTPAQADDAWLGVSLQRIDDTLREALGLDDRDGVLVSDVAQESPAEEAGIEKGDVILEIEGRAATSTRRVVRAIERQDPGQEIEITLLRDGERRTVRATLAERDDDYRVIVPRRGGHTFRVPDVPTPPMAELAPLARYFGRPRLGVETRAIDADLAPYFGVAAGQGVLVLDVMRDTPAEDAGLLAGDVILRVDDENVDSPGDLRDLLLDFEGETVALTLMRMKEEITVEVELDDAPRGLRGLGRGHASVFTLPGGAEEELREELRELRDELDALREELRALERD